MRVAVTGATGFLGKHVVAALLARGASLTLAVRPEAPLPESLAGQPTVACDVSSPPKDLFEKLGRPDVLVHLAWAGLPHYKSLHHFETELPRQYSFLQGLVASGLPRLVAAGTCLEYGMISGALDEETETRPSNPYGFAKDALRRQLTFLQSKFEFSMIWARLFYMYGPGQPRSSLWSLFNAALDAGEEVFPMSGGEQLRDYLPVQEVAFALAACVFEQAMHGVVNICSGRPVSVRSLVEGWRQADGREIQLQFGALPYPDYEPMAFWGRRDRLDDILRVR